MRIHRALALSAVLFAVGSFLPPRAGPIQEEVVEEVVFADEPEAHALYDRMVATMREAGNRSRPSLCFS